MRFRYISSRASLRLRARRAVTGLAGAISALTLAGGIVTAAPASAALNAPINGGYYYLENLDAETSGCLDANLNTLPANGTRVQTWQCNGWANQTWITTVHHTMDNSWYTIQNSDGDQCLDANANTLPANGTRVQMWDCNGYTNQGWNFTPDGTTLNGYPVFTISNQRGGQCLDANANTLPANGTTVQVWDCNGGGNQDWILIPIS